VLQSVIQATWVNNKRKPLDDPRIRRAMHLVLDKPVLVDVVKDVTPMMVGGFIYPFSEFATPNEELAKRLGYQDDPAAAIREARALMAAAGYSNGIKGLDYMVRDIARFKLWSQAIQAMLQEGLNIQCNLRTVVESVWFDDIKTGNYDLAIGAIVSALLDPSDYFNAWYGKDGPQNYSFWDNKEFQALSAQIDREVDATKRPGLIRQAEAIVFTVTNIATENTDAVPPAHPVPRMPKAANQGLQRCRGPRVPLTCLAPLAAWQSLCTGHVDASLENFVALAFTDGDRPGRR
jgi:peptide/nickel transport system substrate-binding protein